MRTIGVGYLFLIRIVVITFCVVPIIHQKGFNVHVNVVFHPGIGSGGVHWSIDLLDNVIHEDERLILAFQGVTSRSFPNHLK